MWNLFKENQRLKREVRILAVKLEIARLSLQLAIELLRRERHVGVADSLSLSYEIDGVTFKSKHMLSNLPVGKSVIATIAGTGKDSTGNVVSAPISGGTLVASEASVQITPNLDSNQQPIPNQFKITAVADKGAGQFTVGALNSLNQQLSAVDSYTTGSAAAPVVADTIALSFSDPV